jgi:hypothetical protein
MIDPKDKQDEQASAPQPEETQTANQQANEDSAKETESAGAEQE